VRNAGYIIIGFLRAGILNMAAYGISAPGIIDFLNFVHLLIFEILDDAQSPQYQQY
jgi:hypothetical protein